MTYVNVLLPEPLLQYVENQVESGDWATPGEYIRELVRQDRERRLGLLEEDLKEGLSAPPIELDVEDVRARGIVTVLHDKVQRD